MENDDRIPVAQLTKRDYRLLVISKDLRNFVKSFERTPYRENINNLGREFQEELFTTNILDKNSFGDLSYKYCGRHMTNIEYGNVFNHFELLLADIIEVRLQQHKKSYSEDLWKEIVSNIGLQNLTKSNHMELDMKLMNLQMILLTILLKFLVKTPIT